jgi:hypothetical protein
MQGDAMNPSTSREPAVVDSPAVDSTAWWRLPIVWLVIAGPALVVVAGIATAFIAAHGADPVLSLRERGGISERSAAPESLTPAVQARNHAATAKP